MEERNSAEIKTLSSGGLDTERREPGWAAETDDD